MDEINRSNDFYSVMFFLDFDSDFSTVDFESFTHFVIDTINLLVKGLCVIRFRGNRARNFKSLARLLSELYSTQSY